MAFVCLAFGTGSGHSHSATLFLCNHAAGLRIRIVLATVLQQLRRSIGNPEQQQPLSYPGNKSNNNNHRESLTLRLCPPAGRAISLGSCLMLRIRKLLLRFDVVRWRVALTGSGAGAGAGHITNLPSCACCSFFGMHLKLSAGAAHAL